MQNIYQPLTKKQIKTLKSQSCTADDWSNIEVAPGFNPNNIHHTRFTGKVRFGVFDKNIPFFGNVEKPAGIYNAHIHNCTIGNNVYIAKISNYIANYTIEDDCTINHVDLLAVEGKSNFGNNTEAVVINEAGGREIPIFDKLTAQIAYIIAAYRHRPKLIETLKNLIADYAESKSSEAGSIAAGCKLLNCGTIKNVNIGPAAVIGNAKRLENGTIISCPDDPAELGANIIAKNFIICSGAKLSDNSIVENCFIGQATKMTKQFSAENSVFFANCGGYHGEACSMFAGPFTVSHHKATLLIAAMTSFFNAGSSSNQSNHMYKLGPVHQAIFERGCKTASGSHVLYPARIGAFTTIIGKHSHNPDTADLPFSYLLQNDDKTYLIPGLNLCTVGTVRDCQKWPKRDKRNDPEKLDLINFAAFSPYTIEKIIKGKALLEQLLAENPDTQIVEYKNVFINKSSLQKGIEYYRFAIHRFLGRALIEKTKDTSFSSIDEVLNIIKPDTQTDDGRWVDLAGMLAPRTAVDNLLEKIETAELNSIDSISTELKQIHENFDNFSAAFAASVLQQIYGKPLADFTADDMLDILTKYIQSLEFFCEHILNDAAKEFSDTTKISFAPDNPECIDADFEQVRGSFDKNGFVMDIKSKTARQTKTAETMIENIKSL